MAEQFQHQHQHRAPNIGEQLRDGLVKPVMGIVITQGTRLVLSKAVDGFFQGSIGAKKEELSERYRDVDKIKPGGYENEWDAGGNDKSDKSDKSDKNGNKNDNPKRQDPVLRANDHLKDAIDSLEKAKKETMCSVCKPKIEEAERYVEDKTKEIIKAGEIYEKMEELQVAGIIAEKPWRELTKEEKTFVRGEVEKSISEVV